MNGSIIGGKGAWKVQRTREARKDVSFDKKKLLRDDDDESWNRESSTFSRRVTPRKRRRKREEGSRNGRRASFGFIQNEINQQTFRVWTSNNKKEKTETHLAEREITRVKEEFLPRSSPFLPLSASLRSPRACRAVDEAGNLSRVITSL